MNCSQTESALDKSLILQRISKHRAHLQPLLALKYDGIILPDLHCMSKYRTHEYLIEVTFNRSHLIHCHPDHDQAVMDDE